MKVLLDENLPHELRHELHGHDVFTVAYMGWSGVKNGLLLAQAANAGLDLFITMDVGVQFQQNLASLRLAVIVLRAASNDMEDLRPLLPELQAAMSTVVPNSVTRIGV